jgi:putative membrane protein
MSMDQPRTPPAALAMQAVRGFCMGVADIVPGVSGGTVALILGIYERLIMNVRTGAGALGAVVKLDIRGAVDRVKSIEWGFVLPLLAGIVIAFGALSHFIEGLLEDHPEEMAGLFLGLVAASVVIAWKLVKTWDVTAKGLLVAVAVAAFVLLGFQSGSIADPSPLQFIGAGAIAICAMILPGISGSFLLVMMGMYAALLGAVNDRELPDLAIFMVGAVIGLALFSTLLGWLLQRHYRLVLAALIGLMIGSVRVLWPWPHGVGIISDEESEAVKGTDLGWADDIGSFLRPTLLALVAFLAVVGISIWGERRISSRAAADTPAAV